MKIALAHKGSLLAMCVALLTPTIASAGVPGGKLKSAEEEMEGRPGEPGSGVPREGVGSPNAQKLKAPLPRRPRSEDEERGIAEMERALARFKQATKQSNTTMRAVLTVEAAEAQKVLEDLYGAQIDEHQKKVQKLRLEAIKRYEDFITKNPADATWTPEIMFRLAELQFDAADEKFRRENEDWEKAFAIIQERRDAGEEVPDDEVPIPPDPDYTASLDLFRSVATDFPNFAYNDAALYMMGVLLYEVEDFDAGRQALLALACHERYEVPSADNSNVKATWEYQAGDYENCKPLRADSKHNTEAWLRIGEMHYDMDELEAALSAYGAAMEDPQSELYAAALIRLAWTLYLKGDFPLAIEKFDDYVTYADSVKGTDAEEGATEFRDDAIKYIAKCYEEPDWDFDGRDDAGWGLPRLDRDYKDRGEEAHVPEIYAALGDLLAFETEFRRAIDIWQLALDRWPNAAAAPMLQLKVLQGWQALQEDDNARAARDKLATNYLRGTPWFYANEDNPDALEKALALAEDALVATAVDHHAYAQQLRSAGDPKAKSEYAIAAKAYNAYLERFPNTPSSYEYRFQYAESLYYSDQFLEAARQYVQVRDSNLDNRLQADASDGVVAALEEYLDVQERAGAFAFPSMPKLDDNNQPPADLETKDLPDLARALQDAYDRHVSIRPGHKDTGKMRFRSAAISQRYNRFDEAEQRFVSILDQHCAEEVAINAGYAIIDAHAVQGDLAGTREWTDKLQEMNCGGAGSAEFAGKLKSIGHAVRFEEARILFEAGEYEAAADRYVALVDEAPTDPNADLALYNAAVSYENIGRFGSASKTYSRIFATYDPCKKDYVPEEPKPGKQKKCSEYSDDALLRTGVNHARFFEYDEAVQSYLVLAEDERYIDSEFRLLALENAALLMDNLQRYGRSANLYKKTARAAKESGDTKLAAEATFRAAEVLGKTDKHKQTIAAYRAYIKAWGSAPEEAQREVEAWMHIGQTYQVMGERKKAEEAYRKTIAQFKSRGLKPATEAADFPAEAQFRLAEYSLKDLQRIQLKEKNSKKLEKASKKLFDKFIVVAQEFDAVPPYRRVEWALAAMYMRGWGFEQTAIKVRRAPVPFKKDTEAYYAYKDIVAESMEPFETKAIALYAETVKRSKQFGISNEWTQRALERLNVYKPDEYPLVRPPALELQVEDRRK